jgi:hypothetical protein
MTDHQERTMQRRALIAVVATAIISLFSSASAKPGADKVYGVIFGIIVDESGKIVSFRVEKVIDPSSGSTAAVKVAVPESYIAAARQMAESKKYEPKLKDGQPVEFYTYFFFDPSQPDRADLGSNP